MHAAPTPSHRSNTTPATGALCFVHPLHHRPGTDTTVRVAVGDSLFADFDGGWRLRGTLDLANAPALDAALAALPHTGDVRLRLDELRFCAAATTTLVRAADQRYPIGRLVLHHPPRLLRRVLHLGWPGDNPGLHVTTP